MVRSTLPVRAMRAARDESQAKVHAALRPFIEKSFRAYDKDGGGTLSVAETEQFFADFEDSFAIFYEAVATDRLQSTLPVLIFD